MQKNQSEKTKENLRENKEEFEVLNFDNPDFKFTPSGNHIWRQRGCYLVCLSCELQHAVHIGMEKRMVGVTKNGDPILKKIEDL